MNYAIETGLRGLRRHPRTMLLSIFTLGLGLASVMTMLSLLAMLSVDPLPGVSQRLHLAWVESRPVGQFGDPRSDDATNPPRLWKLVDTEAMFATQPQIRQTALVPTQLVLQSATDKRGNSRALLASGPMLSMFGVPLLHGRHWTPQEERERAPVVILDALTSQTLLGTPDGTGQSVRIGKAMFRVIGISREWNPQPHVYALQDGEAAWGSQFAVNAFLPLRAALDAGVVPMSGQDCDRGGGGYRFDALDTQGCRFLQVWAELTTPQAVARYREALQTYAQDRHAAGAFPRPANSRLSSVSQWLTANRVVPDNVHLNLWLAAGLLALCMVNVAGLLAARFLRRSGELGVRRVLGATRRAIVIPCLVEAGAAGVIGGVLALPLTLLGLWLIRQQDQGYTEQAHLNPALFLALLLLAALTGLLVGVIPSWRAARLEPALQVKSQ
jgi:putative ABC transport system permease protein